LARILSKVLKGWDTRLKPKSMRTKMLVYFGFISIFMFAIFTVSFYFLFKQNHISSTKDKLRTQAFKIKNSKKFRNLKSNFPFTIIENGKVIYQVGNFEIENLQIYIKNKKSFFLIDIEDHTDALYILRLGKTLILVLKKEFDDKVEDIINTMILLELLLFILFIFLANNILNKTLNPIKHINQAAKEISIEDFKSHIKISNRDDEIAELTSTFNEMIDRLKNGVEKLDRFNSDVSHELKTPLTVIDMQIELALKKHRDEKYYKNSLQTIQYEVSKIKNIVEELLLIARYSKQDIKETFLVCDFNTILINAIDKHASSAKMKNIEIEILRFEKAIKESNYSLINTIFSNLIDNAIKYTQNGKNIYISLFTKDKKIHYIVKDEGIGIPKDKINKITDRFYRVDESRNKSIKGFGLGLSIVKNSIVLHNGTLHVESEVGVGTTIEVIL